LLTSEDFEKFVQEKDRTTGDIYTVGSMLDLAGTVQYQERQSTADRMLTAFSNGIKGVIRDGLHGLRGLRDLNELQLNRDHPERRPGEQWARDMLDEAANAEILQAHGVQADSTLGQLGYDLLQGSGQLAVQAGLYMLPGGQVLSPAAMALQISGAEYEELRQQGVDVETAEKAGLINAAVQTPLEYIGLSRLMRAVPAGSMIMQRIRHAAENALTEGVTEFAQEYPEQISKIWALNTDKTPEEIVQIVGENIGDITRQAGYSGTIGALLGLGASAPRLALDRNLSHAMQKEVHTIRMETEEQRINDMKKVGVNPDYAAAVINDNTQGELVYVDGAALSGYAQEQGAAKVAESLGVSVEAIEEAAANGDTVDVQLGNFEATAAKYDGFFQAVKNDTAFEEGGYTVNREQQERELARQAAETDSALRAQQDRIVSELKAAGMNNDVSLQTAALVAAQAMNRNNPIEAMRQYRIQLGKQAATTYTQSMYDVRKAGAKNVLDLKERIEQRRSDGEEVNKLQFSSDNGIRYAEPEIVHATKEHGITDEEWLDLEKHGAEIKEPRLSKWKEYTGQYLGKVIVGRIDGDLGSYYVAYEFSPNGDVWFKTAARGSMEGLNNKIEELGAVMLSPEENSPDAVSHSHGSSLNSIKDFLGIGKGYEQTGAEIKGEYDPDMNIISLFEGADASTVIHETWHFFIEQMWKDVQSGAASEQTARDFDKLLDYAGMTRKEWEKADTEGRRAAHEKLAEAGETYIMEGKSPSYELRRVFRKFATWLRNVYREIQRSGNAAELTDDVREVFDRMLAAEDDINRMERINGYFAKLPDVITDGMDETTKGRVEDFIAKARDKAVETLTRRAMKDYTKKRREEVRALRAELLPKVTAEINEDPRYKSGYTKKDAAKYEKLQNKQKALTEKESAWLLEADLQAEALGYSGSSEMFQDIKTAPTKSEAITARVNDLIKINSPAAEARAEYEDAVREAIYNEEESLLIGVEQQLIEDYVQKARGQQEQRKISAEVAAARRQQAKLAAHADLSNMNMREATRTDKFIAAERKAAVRSAQMLIKKNYDQALAQKNLQAYWHAMAAESLQIRKRRDQYNRFLKTQVRLNPDSWLNEEHFAAISNLFVRMGIARQIHEEAAEADPTNLDAYAAKMETLYDCVDIPEWLRIGDVDLHDVRALTLEQYEDVINTIKNIKAIVKAQKGVDMFDKKQTFEDMKADIMGRFAKLKTVFTPNPNKRTKAGLIEKTTAEMENLDTFLEKLDGADYGYFSETWGLAIKHANDHEFECTEAYQKAESEAISKWLPDKKAQRAAAEEIYYEELGNSASKYTLVQMLMNLGNAGNSQRLCETPPVGFEGSNLWIRPAEDSSFSSKERTAARKEAADMTRKNLIAFLSKVLKPEDVEYAQRKIDAAGMFWGEKNELEKRTKGFGMGKIEATPVVLTIDGKPVVLRGGYFPLIRNGEMGSHSAAKEVAEDDPLQGNRVRTYHTNTGATKARTQAQYPVSLVAGSETGWIQESIHDLCWRETVSSFRRLLNDPEIFGMMKSKVGVARMNNWKDMLEVCADPMNSKSFANGKTALDDAFAWIRGRTSHAVIMCKLKVITQNYANALLYGDSIKGYTLADNIRAIGRYMISYHFPGKHAELVNFVNTKSAFMRERCEVPDITVRDIMDEKNEYFWEEYTRRIGVQLMALTDNASAVPNWIEAYNKKINEGATEQEAIDFADVLVRRVLGSSRPSDVSKIQRGNEAQRLLTMFQSFFNARLNEFERMSMLAEKQWTEGQRKEAFLTAFAYTVNKWLLQTTMAMALAAQNPFGIDDEDGWPELIKELKSYSFSMLGPIGAIGNYVVGKAAGMHEFNYRLSAIESTVDKLGRAVSFGKNTSNLEKLERVTDSAGTLVGIPYQLNILLWNTVDILLNDMEPQWGDLFRRRPKKERVK